MIFFGGGASARPLFPPKRLYLLHDLVPSARLVAVIANPTNPTLPFQLREVEAAARAIGQDILVLNVSNESELDAAFATLVERKAGAILYLASTLFQVLLKKVVALAARHAIPAMYEWPEFVTAGGLISYSTSRAESGHQIGSSAGRVLKGAKSAELPVVQSTKFELVINLRTARALSLTVPQWILLTANEVIE